MADNPQNLTTLEEIDTHIELLFPDNDQQYITPQDAREVCKTIARRIFLQDHKPLSVGNDGNGLKVDALTQRISLAIASADSAGAISAIKAAMLEELATYMPYLTETVSTYAEALAKAKGTRRKLFVVLVDETDDGAKNRYFYEGIPGELEFSL
ncbi:hypothetical protein [Siphonobacter sp. SORGH_AS_0500]|uniref:hypothetical protein n=1 Tax=Siphonobacter sp. SORGH_AS_0500 TaxID=1864824 RepID=UPI00286131E9|nr:hypothetical protein [Siphonobacter sp. SORGH_AS_0500]MDR6195650.1 hypothetical protein [Siphonobacter sp. SORGH_AS_0500]